MSIAIALTTPVAPDSTPKPAPRRSWQDMVLVMGAKLLYALTRVALPPLTLAHVGMADYGLWATCFILVSYLGMTASGFTIVYLRGVAHARGENDTDAIGRLLSTGMLCMSTISIGLFAVLLGTLPGLLNLFHVDPSRHELAGTLWLGACGVFLADMVLGAFANTLHALNKIREEQMVWVAAFVIEMVLIVVFLNAGWGLRGLLAAFALRYLFSASANAWIVHRALPDLRLSPRLFDTSLLRMFFGFGTGVQLGGLIATLLHSADRLLAGALIGPHATAVFDLATKLPVTGASIPSSVSYVALSQAARTHATGDREGLRRVHRDAVRLTVIPLALIVPPLAVFAPLIISAWLGRADDTPLVATAMTLLAFGMHWHLLTGPASAVFRGCGRLLPEYAYYAMRLGALAMAVVAWKLSPESGLIGLATVLCVAQVIAAVGYLIGSSRALGHPLFAGLVSAGGPTAAAYAAAGLLWLVWPRYAPGPRLQEFMHLAGLGTAWLVVTTVGAWYGLLDTARKAQIIDRLQSLADRMPWRTP
jgi:O-antigen/teichoic acid export membrane protein